MVLQPDRRRKFLCKETGVSTTNHVMYEEVTRTKCARFLARLVQLDYDPGWSGWALNERGEGR